MLHQLFACQEDQQCIDQDFYKILTRFPVVQVGLFFGRGGKLKYKDNLAKQLLIHPFLFWRMCSLGLPPNGLT